MMKKTALLFIFFLMVFSVYAEVDFNPKIQRTTTEWFVPRKMELGTNPIVTIQVINNGDPGSAKCEVGIYTEDTVRAWFDGRLPGYDFTFSIETWEKYWPNCVSNEPFVTTKNFYLTNGQKEIASFQPYVPYYFTPSESFVVYASCYNECYLVNPTGFKNYGADTLRVDIVDPLENYEPITNHCENNKIDSSETDFDCGGKDCAKCQNGLRCLQNTDCATGYCGSDNKCVGQPTRSPTPTPTPSPTPQRSIPLWVVGLIIAVLGVLVLVVLKKK